VQSFSSDLASFLAKLPMAGVCREYPNMLQQVLNGPEDLKTPKQLHPAFYGCFDWHSSVHGHWMLVKLLKLFRLDEDREIRGLLNANLSEENLKQEADYLDRPNTQSFERPYGWGWLLQLAQELEGWDDEDGKMWREAIRPLESRFVERFLSFFPKQTYAVRGGTHSNSALGLTFAFDYAVELNRTDLKLMVEERARSYYLADTAYQTSQEPSGADFLSPCLIEANLMRRVLSAEEFTNWFHRFLPELKGATTILTPATVSDRSDPQIGHLDGLNLSRAWCMFGIAGVLPPTDPYRAMLINAAESHADEGLKNIATGDYMGEHWLASFAVYLLSHEG